MFLVVSAVSDLQSSRYMIFSYGGKLMDRSTIQVRVNDNEIVDETGKIFLLLSLF